MKNLKFLTILFFGTFCFISSKVFSQIEVSKILQESKIVETESNKLYFVDFWATWCGPCVYSKKILTVLQQQYPQDFHAISISEENAAKIERFIQKNPTLLTVVVDNEGKTFKDYGVKALPQGILFNAKGDKLWEGHPSDLKPNMLNKYLREHKTRKPLNRFVKLVKSKIEISKDYQPKKDIEIKVNKTASADLEISTLNTHIKLQGSLANILSHLSKINEKQISISPRLDRTYSIYIIKTLLNSPNKIDIKVLDMLGLSVNESSKNGEAIILKVKNAKFWDTDQINWGW